MSRPDIKGNPPSWEGEEIKALSNTRRKRRVWLGGSRWGDRGSAHREAAPTRRVPAVLGLFSGSQLGHQPTGLNPGVLEASPGGPCRRPTNPAASSQPLRGPLSSASVSPPGHHLLVVQGGKHRQLPRRDHIARDSCAQVRLLGQPHHLHPWASPAAPPCRATPHPSTAL